MSGNTNGVPPRKVQVFTPYPYVELTSQTQGLCTSSSPEKGILVYYPLSPCGLEELFPQRHGSDKSSFLILCKASQSLNNFTVKLIARRLIRITQESGYQEK